MELKVRVTPVYSYIDKYQIDFREFVSIIRNIDEKLRIQKPGFYFMSSYKQGIWDGYIRFISAYGSFLTGLLPHIKKIYPLIEIYPDSYLQSIPEDKIDYSLKGIELREYQKEAVRVALKEKRGVIKSPAGSGKTEIACCIVKNICKQSNNKVLWVTHTKDLVLQTAKRFSTRTDLKVSVCSEGNIDFSGDIVVSTIQTLYKHRGEQKDILASLSGVIFDECHLGTAQTWVDILKLCKGAWYRIGLSATPFTDDPVRNRELEGILGSVIYTPDKEELKRLGYIVDTEVIGTFFQHKKSYMSYPDAMEYGVVTNQARNNLIVETILNKPCGLILVNYIRHGEILKGLLEDRGVKVKFLCGEISADERERAVDSLKKGEYHCLIATSIFDFGVDIPQIKWVFLASPSKSSVRILQRIGRGARKSKDKLVSEVFVILDGGDKYLRSSATKFVNVVEKENLPMRTQNV